MILLLGSSCLYSQASNADLQRDYEAGEQALSEHRYADAERAYEKLERLSPGTAEVYGRLGLVYFQERKFDRAVSALRRAMKLKPGLPNTDILLAMSLSELGRYSEGIREIHRFRIKTLERSATAKSLYGLASRPPGNGGRLGVEQTLSERSRSSL